MKAERLVKFAVVIGGTPEALARLLKSESAQYGKIIRTVGIKGE